MADKANIDEFAKKRLDLIKETRMKIRESVSKDNLLVQAISSLSETEKIANTLVKRLREWYGFYCPEFSESVDNHQKFTELILKKSKDVLLKEIKVSKEDTMGADLEDEDIDAIMDLAQAITRLYETKDYQTKYIGKIMDKYAPNVTAITGPLIGAKLILLAGSLKKLALFPASTIQLLGAEKALFRHLKTGARSPKYGIIHEHPFISKTKKRNHGKVARILADKISIAAKVDFFKGEFVGNNLKKQVEDKIKGM